MADGSQGSASPAPADPRVLLRTESVGKEFGGVWVLKGVDFDLREGEVHALVGENGAGKSTFVKIVSGVHRPSEGAVYFQDGRVDLRNVLDSERLGVRTVHQEINLVPFFDVVENVFVGSEIVNRPLGLPLVDRRSQRKQVLAALEALGIDLDPGRPAHSLEPSLQRVIEICKALVHKARVMIFDEPTTSLAERERSRLLGIIRGLKEHLGVIYVSHNLDEVFSISDRVTVFRDGLKIATVDTGQCSEAQLISMMVGGKRYQSFRKAGLEAGGTPEGRGAPEARAAARAPGAAPPSPLLELRNVTTRKLRRVSLSLRPGEVLGVAGVVGAGKTELARAAFGFDRIEAGDVLVDNERFAVSPHLAVKKGLALIPEERQAQGLVMNMSVVKNITLAYLSRWARNGVVSLQQEKDVAARCVAALDIKTRGHDQLVRLLSGGNQQKVVLARWLCGDFLVGVFDEPTKGIDVKTRQDIYRLVDDLARRGKGILFLSSYLPEIMSVSDRVLVLRDGAIQGEFDPRQEGAEGRILAAMIGGKSA